MKNKSQFLVMDLDGTLLDSSEEISDATIQAIRQAKALGVKTAIATGRIVSEAQFAIELAGVEDYLIEMNGAKITDLRTQEVLYDQPMSSNFAADIIDYLGEEYVYQLYTDQGVFCTEYSFSRLEDAGMSKHYLAMFGTQIQQADRERLKSLRSYKFLVIEKDTEKEARLAKKIATIPQLTFVNSLPNYHEVVLAGMDKRIALEKLSRLLNIPPEKMVAIGDSNNDREMLNYVGVGAVLANGNQQLKEEIGVVFPSNDEDGVRHVIEAMILNKRG
ncbi:Cof-type HAD-IIB family hydrolase [Enterococcus sp. DIV0756]|uniref:Cof-type HAD-IIB family hydrolase n=1 Tax=Enterococcus sp. DIV0756 TaxID=2774636 RepID=UPI003F68962A